VTAADRSDLLRLADRVSIPAWLEFMLQDPVSENWPELYRRFPAFQFALTDRGGDIVAVGNSIPLAWEGDPAELPDTGWDWALVQSLQDHAADKPARTLCALQVVVAQSHRGKGISAEAIRTMKRIGEEHGLASLIVPARPTLKSRYPLIPMERYIEWRADEGLPFDPWLRAHARLGGATVKVCPRSMRITGSVSDWEEWTGMRFPGSGRHVVPGALVPVEIDHARDIGVYVEPNVWTHHLPGRSGEAASGG
jgi:GNAT superfamily N-acetyltransferase